MRPDAIKVSSTDLQVNVGLQSGMLRKDSKVIEMPLSPLMKRPKETGDRSSSPDIKAKKSGKKSGFAGLQEDDPELSMFKSIYQPIYLTHDPEIAELDNKLRRK